VLKNVILELYDVLQDRVKHVIPNQIITKLSKRQLECFEEIKRNNRDSKHPFIPTGIVWDKISMLFEKRLHIDGLGIIEDQKINHWFSAFKPTHKKYYFYALWMLYERLKERDKYDILARTVASATEKNGIAVEINGKLLSWDYLISVESIISMADFDPDILTKPNVILDLGAGWGRMGYLLKSLNPLITYIISDIPVSLMVSQHYLPTVLPHEKVFNYQDNKKIQKFTHNYFGNTNGLHFLGSQDLSRFDAKSIDFFINIASFQEMTQDQVDCYFSIINRITRKAVYLQQRYMGDEVSRQSYPYDQKWKKIFDRDIIFAPKYFESLYEIGN
jgi:putative sugar O-methyltransferase